MRRKQEPHLRALLLRAVTDSAFALRGLSSVAAGPDADTRTVLAAHLVTDGSAEAALDDLVGRMSLEPGVRSVSWRHDDGRADDFGEGDHHD